MDHQYSPKPGSPMETRSPSIAQNVDPSSLKVKICMNTQKSPFYLIRPEPTPNNETTGATNLMAARGLEHSYIKLTTKKMKDSLSSFLSNLPGVIDTPPGMQENSSLRGIIDKPPVVGKELRELNQLQLAGFRLHPGPLPEQYRCLLNQVQSRRKHKRHKHKHKSSGGDLGQSEVGSVGGAGSETKGETEEREKKREKKHKKHDKDAEERKRKKKEKKRKKNKEDKDS